MLSVSPLLASDIDAAIAVAELRPEYFVPAGVAEIRYSMQHDPGAVARDDAGNVIGFLTWTVRRDETELMWMAALPSAATACVSKRLFQYCFERIDLSKRVYLCTATTDSVIPDTLFNARKFERTIALFEAYGFSRTEIRPSYWGPKNHCLVMDLDARRSPLCRGIRAGATL